NTSLYLFTDGFADQISGNDFKKYGIIRFQKFILEQHQLNFSDQLAKIAEEFKEWKGACKQVDDVLVVGLKI
ncbi:MAG: hypothetical protein HY958_01970, partial [Bacteroidia bacterium]|nr:hypothetical protein [Bacteroidia bacterium]